MSGGVGRCGWLGGVLATAASGAAFAHVGEHGAGGLAAGLAHPFAGLDHLLAMVAVGAWATQLGGRWRLLLPATFVAAMAAGAGAGLIGIPLPHVESLIALSVLALGALVAVSVKAGWLWPAALVALFALFHGHAHGVEMPAFASPGLYFAGFLTASAALHAIGVATATVLGQRPALLRAGGAAIGLAGTWLLVAAFA